MADYFRCFPPKPKGMSDVLTGFHVIMQSRDPDGTHTQLAMGSDDPAPTETDKVAVLYDLNVEKWLSEPRDPSSWRELAAEVHDLQRRIFENSITDRTRELFT